MRDKSVESMIAVILLFMIGLLLLAIHSDRKKMSEGYAAWVKLTGNTNHLTLDEWKALVRSTKNNNEAGMPVFIYMPR